VIVSIAKVKAPDIASDIAAQRFKIFRAVHPQRRVVGPEDRPFLTDQYHALRQTGNDLTKATEVDRLIAQGGHGRDPGGRINRRDRERLPFNGTLF
jgi:hypothetical protein